MDIINLLESVSINELTSDDVFDKILDEHNEKFRYMHSFLKSVDMKTLKKVKFCNCKTNDYSIIVELVTSSSGLDKLQQKLESELSSFSHDDDQYFNITIYPAPYSSYILLIDVRSIRECREDDLIYAD